MASSGEVNVVFFTEEMQKYDYIYNKDSKSYKDNCKYIKMNCWAKIGEKFDMSAADAEKKFKNIRTGYGRYLRKLKSFLSGFGRDAVPVRKDFAGLDWLQQYISHRTTVSNMSVNRVEVDSDEDDNEQGDTNNQTQAGSETPKDSSRAVETSTESGVDKKTTESADVVERKRRKSMFPNYLLSFLLCCIAMRTSITPV